MSDRVIVNKCIEDQLSAEKGSKLNTFKCAIHPLDTIAKNTDGVLVNFEEEQHVDIKQFFKRRGESFTQALIKGVGKLFYSESVGCNKDLTEFLFQQSGVPDCETADGVKRVYHRFVGNRFHIYFLVGGLSYHYSEHLLQFFLRIHTQA